MSRRAPSTAALQAECDAFNAKVAVGGKVSVKLDGKDNLFATRTRSEAQVIGGHSAVIWLENVSGSYLLDRVLQVGDAEWAALQSEDEAQAERMRERRRKNFAARVVPSTMMDPDFEGEQTLYVTHNGRQEYPTTLAPHEAEQVVAALCKAFNIKP